MLDNHYSHFHQFPYQLSRYLHTYALYMLHCHINHTLFCWMQPIPCYLFVEWGKVLCECVKFVGLKRVIVGDVFGVVFYSLTE